MRVHHRTQGYLSLIQQDHRHYNNNYQYSLSRLILLKIDKATNTLTRYINDFVDCDRDGTVNVELDPGDYYILTEIDWKCNFNRQVSMYLRQVVLNFYGQHPVAFIEDS